MGTVYNKSSSNRTKPTVAYSASGNSRVNGFNKNFTLPKGYYYLNMHFNVKPGSGKVTANTVWTLTGATPVYVNNGTGNYNCNALYQGLIYGEGSQITLSSTDSSGSPSTAAFPYELVVYKM